MIDLIRRAWRRLRRHGRPTASRTLTVTITADAARFREAMAEATSAALRMRDAFGGIGVTTGAAAAALDRLMTTAASHPALRELRQRAALNEIRTRADVHRHELARWWDDHLDHMYADLGLTREDRS